GGGGHGAPGPARHVNRRRRLGGERHHRRVALGLTEREPARDGGNHREVVDRRGRRHRPFQGGASPRIGRRIRRSPAGPQQIPEEEQGGDADGKRAGGGGLNE